MCLKTHLQLIWKWRRKFPAKPKKDIQPTKSTWQNVGQNPEDVNLQVHGKARKKNPGISHLQLRNWYHGHTSAFEWWQLEKVAHLCISDMVWLIHIIILWLKRVYYLKNWYQIVSVSSHPIAGVQMELRLNKETWNVKCFRNVMWKQPLLIHWGSTSFLHRENLWLCGVESDKMGFRIEIPLMPRQTSQQPKMYETPWDLEIKTSSTTRNHLSTVPDLQPWRHEYWLN